jgi:hypothetical protein
LINNSYLILLAIGLQDLGYKLLWGTAVTNNNISSEDDIGAYFVANIEAVGQVIRGLGPDDKEAKSGAGARIVFNMSCAHLPEFCGAVKDAYKNAYDLNKQSQNRIRVDEAIAKSISSKFGITLEKEHIYFGAVETSGTGIRFYGDMCLVLSNQPDSTNADSEFQPKQSNGTTEIHILDRNSYDIIREPISSALNDKLKVDNKTFTEVAAEQLENWLGCWSTDLVKKAQEKVRSLLPSADRRWTTGQISDAIIKDEDYLEVLYPQSFSVKDLFEVRINAADAAAEADIADREAMGEAPSLNELEWRQQRREARRSLVESGIRIRIITTTGRSKGI